MLLCCKEEPHRRSGHACGLCLCQNCKDNVQPLSTLSGLMAKWMVEARMVRITYMG
jgi:hypothetical protein